jgi:hypothetical protein
MRDEYGMEKASFYRRREAAGSVDDDQAVGRKKCGMTRDLGTGHQHGRRR